MGRSSKSCLKIISCAGSNDSVDPDDIHENKGSDKRGWSFRKRSARHRVLSNSVVTETPSSEKKESSGPITILEPQVNANISEKTSDNIWIEEAPRLSTSVNKIATDSTTVTETACEDDTKNATASTIATEAACEDDAKIATASTIATETACEDDAKIATASTTATETACEDDTKHATVSAIASETTCEDDIKSEPVLDESKSEAESESAILVIQGAVRQFLAKKELVRYKNVIKLQAAVRGHLVRSHAVGTLRCVQAIVKMQALVRARHANLSTDRSTVGEKGGVQNPTHISIDKLLSNSLARQLLESTPKTKQINIKCDPSKSDSAWNWLERWMSVSTPETIESHAPQQDEDKVKNTENHVETVIPSHCESEEMNSNVVEAPILSEEEVEEENMINIEENSHVRNDEEEKPQLANTYVPDPIKKPDSSVDEPMDLNTEPQVEVVPIPEKPVSEPEPKRSAKRLATDQPDSEGRKSVFGRKASNPAFIAAQSRFEELTSNSNSLKSPTSSNQHDDAGSLADISSSDPLKQDNKLSYNQDNEVGSSVDIGSSAPEKTSMVTDDEPEEYNVSHSPKMVPRGGSECGTELSITSTLDSPDQFEVANKKIEEEAKVEQPLDDRDIIVPEKHDSSDAAELETKNIQPANNVAISQVEEKLDDNDIELELESGTHVYKSNAHMELDPEPKQEAVPQVSAEGSPRSHITVPESQGTPSSQVSTNTKKTRSEKKVSSQKRKSWSGSKKPSADSGLRRSLDQLPKDPKPEKAEKRRNSFGSPRPDNSDQEPSVPSYMQATESARAKAIANSSPRSSPDVQDVKKRHSLPGAVNGRQGSPRIQRSMSQAVQTTKANGNQERKWQR